MDWLTVIGLLGLTLLLIFWLAPSPKLDAEPPQTRVPQDLTPAEMAGWLADEEARHGNVIEGAEARIFWASNPEPTELCVLYVHGFSASRQEISPVPEAVSKALSANLVCARLAGHGLSTKPMQASVEDWLQSVTDAWEIASRIGNRVVIVAVSTGAPLSIWLTQRAADSSAVHSLLFMSPNFRIRHSFGFILTWPWAKVWVPKLMGEEREWEPENDLVARYWSNRYSINAVIEVQKVVDWVRRTKLDSCNIPLATLYMAGDPTISHEAAIAFHEAWQADSKELIEVPIDPENVQHVFTGNISAPHRVDWTVETCLAFIRST